MLELDASKHYHASPHDNSEYQADRRAHRFQTVDIHRLHGSSEHVILCKFVRKVVVIFVNCHEVTSKLIISGDTDFASNKFLFSAKNEDLFANSINWLTSDVELISIRPKIKVFRELVLTQDERNFVRWSGWIFLPGISIFLALWSWWRRR